MITQRLKRGANVGPKPAPFRSGILVEVMNPKSTFELQRGGILFVKKETHAKRIEHVIVKESRPRQLVWEGST
jgi:hypothetical protein